ncbi:hypothetical protein N7452_006920 [Penicillium brevicompactum]|uniref:Uncharacterized protein n=1 Tax=Penicillium brevicompactum TaxID=5074 RepID=A0A9W9QFQ7_PENBR|nr:hypothetical protein N7452_006920 [Penicillium brevicompactum]
MLRWAKQRLYESKAMDPALMDSESMFFSSGIDLAHARKTDDAACPDDMSTSMSSAWGVVIPGLHAINMSQGIAPGIIGHWLDPVCGF